MKRLVTFSCALLISALVSCSAGGRTSAVPPASAADAAVKLAVTIAAPSMPSASQRRPAYLPANVASIELTVTASTQTAPPAATVNVAPGAHGTSDSCTSVSGGTYTCTIGVDLPPGRDTLSVASFSGSNATGNKLSQQSVVETVVAGAANDFTSKPIVFDAVVSAIRLTLTSGTLSGSSCSGTTIAGSTDLSATCTATDGSSGNSTFTVAVLDASGNVIPTGATGYPVLSAATSNASNFTVSLSGATLTVSSHALGGAKITVTAGPAESAGTSPGDGLSAVALSFDAAAASSLLYVTEYASNTISMFAPTASGNVAPLETIAGSNTKINEPEDVAFDASGNIYVANDGAASIAVFPAGSSGNVAPSAVITGAATGIVNANSVALDSSGKIYDVENDGVLVFAAGANGNVAPIAKIIGANTQFNTATFAVVAPDGTLYVADYNNAISTFAAGANGNVAPATRISGSATGLASPTSVRLDASGNIFVANSGNNTVTEYQAGSNGNVAPIATLSTNALNQPFDAYPFGGTLYVSNFGGNSVVEFPLPANGSLAPSVTISGSATGLDQPSSVVLH